MQLGKKTGTIQTNDSGHNCKITAMKKSAGFFHPAAADAGSADFHGSVGAVVVNMNGLDIRFESARGHFHNVHTDTAFFLGKTSADDSCTLNFFLTANFADIAHFTPRLC